MAIRDFQFCHSFRVRYSEIDGQKVVFNAHYLTYFDTAITEYFRWLPFDYMQYVEGSRYDFHTVRTVVEYKAPVFFDEEIEVYVRVSNIRRSSLTFVVELYGKRDEKRLRTIGEVVWVHVDEVTGKPSSLNVNLVSRLQQRFKEIAL